MDLPDGHSEDLEEPKEDEEKDHHVEDGFNLIVHGDQCIDGPEDYSDNDKGDDDGNNWHSS